MRLLLLLAAVGALLTGCGDSAIDLDPSNWRCTRTVVTPIPITTMVGKVPVTTMINETECVQYTRRDQPQ